MARVLILFAHRALEESRVNRRLRPAPVAGPAGSVGDAPDPSNAD